MASGDDNTEPDKNSLPWLPPEIHHITIAELRMALKDRLSLHATCRKLAATVASIDYKVPCYNSKLEYGPLLITQKGERSTTVVVIEDEKGIRLHIPIHLAVTLFNRICFGSLNIDSFDFSHLESSELRASMERLLYPSDAKPTVVAEEFYVGVDADTFNERLIDLINNVNARKFRLQMKSPMDSSFVEQIKTFNEVELLGKAFSLSDATFLALVKNQKKFTAEQGTDLLKPEKIAEARKIVADFGTQFKIHISREQAKGMLATIRVRIEGNSLATNNDNVRITSYDYAYGCAVFNVYFDKTRMELHFRKHHDFLVLEVFPKRN